MDTNIEPNDNVDVASPVASEKLTPKGIAAARGEMKTVDDVQKRVEQLKAETMAREAEELAALKAQTQPVEPVTTIAPEPQAKRPGYDAEKPPMEEGEPLKDKGLVEKPINWSEGENSGHPER